MEPGLGDRPFTFHRGARDAEYHAGFLDGEAAKEPQLDEARLIGIQSLEITQRSIDGDDVEQIGSAIRRRGGQIL